MKSILSACTLLLCVLSLSNAFSQSSETLINTYLSDVKESKGLSEKDIQNWVVTDQYTSKTSGVQNIYIRQTYQDIELYNAVANFHIKDNKVLTAGIRLERNVAQRVNTTAALLSPFDAITAAANHLKIPAPKKLKIEKTIDAKNFLINGGELSLESIPVQLMYMSAMSEDKAIRLVWDLSIYEFSKDHWWSMRVDALTGEVIDQVDWVVSCTFEGCGHSIYEHTTRRDVPELASAPAPAPPPGTDAYRVFAIPAESPNHAPRSLVVGPFDAAASPFGWHDDNGIAGAEYLTTQGNNVRATEDANDNNGTGYFPNGGAALNFDFPLNLNNAPNLNWDPAITNLFYMNNIMHDVWYQYGFDEVSGNFQENAYGNGGNASDMVFAEAQDGGGTNNANFATPGDGNNPRMQMYLWSAGAATYLLNVNSPTAIAGQYLAVEAQFGPGAPATPLTGNFVLVDDGTALSDEGCSALINGTAISGNIAIVMRGTCGFNVKIQNAQNAGATAVIVINNVPGAPFAMGGTSTTITIPSIMISDVDGAAILAQMGIGVNGTIQAAGVAQQIDGDFDNGIIAHEYGHGISNRLTGGPSASGCLSNAEQMGEGWSDWFGLMLTIEPGDMATDGRGIGTFAIAEPTTGDGIRPTPYSTDFIINPSTYSSTNNTGGISQPHGIGYVWCTMLWDLNWALVNQYGFDSDVYNGTGGNNIAMHLVIEGLKLQPCSPGFVDGRDAILAADVALYGGANQCLIWEVFANRGLGFSAAQGSTNSRTDQTEAFDLPTQCQTPTLPPIADFGFEDLGCDGTISFTDSSIQIPNQWLWDFGDGVTSTFQNPVHQYATGGSYTVTLIATNIIGTNTISQVVTVSMLTPPIGSNAATCAGLPVTLSATATDSVIWWNAAGTTSLDTGYTYVTPPLNTSTTFMIENVAIEPILNVGPLTAAIGTSGYHTSTIDFALNFTSTSANGFTILSAWVDAGSTGIRTINVWDAADAGGTIIGTAVVNITATGPQRIPLNIDVLTPGNYSIGGTGMNMRRNNNGAPYPFTLPGIVSITSSSASAPAQYYYYLYDWEVQEIACRSSMVPVTVTVNPVDSTIISETSCGQYTWPVTGSTYTSSGTYTSLQTNSFGCDSIVFLNLTINQSPVSNQVITSCGAYQWYANSQTYAVSGNYTLTVPNTSGCDSILNLNLTIANPSSGSETTTACTSYTWAANGTTYGSSGTYGAILTNTEGCDSTVTLNLTVNSPSTGSETINTCSSYLWPANGATYSSTGSYTTILSNVLGCDSVVTLNLTVSAGSTSTTSETSCDSYTWPASGNTYTATGIYSITYTDVNGCDSIVNLDLTINEQTNTTETVTECDSYTWATNGTTYTSSGTYTESYTTVNGCDSIITLNLTINTVSAAASYVGDITLQATSNSSSYQWVDCNNSHAPIAGETGQSFTATSNGNYAVIVTQNGCSDTSECFIISKVGLIENDFGALFKVYPNPTHGNLKIDLGAVHSGIVTKVFDAKGKLVKETSFGDAQILDLQIEGERGVYFIEIATSNGRHAKMEIIKN